jgi:hemerythrin
MSIYKWSEDYASGFTTIDIQHKELFEKINMFEDTQDNNTNAGDASAFIELLIRHCHNHFQHEDELMDIQKYPLNEYHRGVHIELINSMLQSLASIKEKRVKSPRIFNTCIIYQYAATPHNEGIYLIKKCKN